jgi:hypothetical protein
VPCRRSDALSAMSLHVEKTSWSLTFEDAIRPLHIFRAPERSELQL